ncbi:MAG: D-alanyl-D-alanine carboxypeptidase [Solirubrobacterales bacterium]|nr:D-alanyl-D-alanine carboxypeptidase [Solirubrobacterales bacterium]
MVSAPAALPAAPEGPRIEAKSWVLVDSRFGDELASHRPHARLPMASTTKLMTAWIALHRLPLNRRVRAVRYHGDPTESLMGLKAGERVSVRDLLYGLILMSGNDAAQTLAVATSGSVRGFVEEMNRTAARMGLDDSHYENPIGLDAPDHYTSASDLAVLARKLMAMPRFRRIAQAHEARLGSLSPPRTIETTNSFLTDYSWARGIKTGHTLKSGFSLVSAGRKRATELIGAAIGAPTITERNTGSARLLEYGFGLYRKQLPIRSGSPVVRVPVRYAGDETVPLVARRTVRLGVRADQDLEVRVTAPERVEGPISRGTRLGLARVTLDGSRVASIPLLAGRRVEAPTWLDRLKAGPALPLAMLAIGVCVILAVIAFVRRRRATRTRHRLRRAVRKR